MGRIEVALFNDTHRVIEGVESVQVDQRGDLTLLSEANGKGGLLAVFANGSWQYVTKILEED
jgi:hypothetical protein